MYKPSNISQDSKFWLIQIYAAKLMKQIKNIGISQKLKIFLLDCFKLFPFFDCIPYASNYPLVSGFMCLYNYLENWHHLIILQLVWMFLMALCSCCKLFFLNFDLYTWIFNSSPCTIALKNFTFVYVLLLILTR